MTRVAQLSIWQHKPNEAVVLTRQIYASRYFDSSLQIDQLIADGDHVYLITHNYGRSSWLAGITGKLIRPIVLSRTLALTDKTLYSSQRPAKRKKMTFTNAKRIQTSILSGPEKATLIWLMNRTPQQINSNHLTALGLIAMLGVGFGYWLSASRPAAGPLVTTAFLAVNWLGDSLDGCRQSA